MALGSPYEQGCPALVLCAFFPRASVLQGPHVVAGVRASSLFLAEQGSAGWRDHILLVRSSMVTPEVFPVYGYL